MSPTVEPVLRDLFAADTITTAPVPKAVAKPQPQLSCKRCCETFLSDHQAARRYGISRAAIWRWVNKDAGFPAPIKLSPGTTRWKLSDLVSFEIQNERDATPRLKAKRAGAAQ